MMDWRNDPATEKQLNFIEQMQEEAGMNGAISLPYFDFSNATKGEACDYIKANIGKVHEGFDFDSHGDNYGDRI